MPDEKSYAEVVEQVQAELDKKKADPSHVLVLPEQVVVDAEFPDGFYFKRPCIQEFTSHGYGADQYDTYFGGTVEAGKPAWGPGWSDPNWSKDLPDGLPNTLHVVSQVRRVGTRTARATSPTRHRFKQYLFGNPSHRLVRNRKLALHTSKVLANIDELILKEKQGILSVHHADGRRVNLLALKNEEFDDVFAAARPAAPQANFPLDSIANDTPSGIPFPIFVEGTWDGDPARERALKSMRADKAAELGEDQDEAKDPALDDSLDEEDDAEDDTADEGGASDDTAGKDVAKEPAKDGAAESSPEDKKETAVEGAGEGAVDTTTVDNTASEETATGEAPDSAQIQPASKAGKGNKKGGKR